MLQYVISALRSGIRGKSFHAIFVLGLLLVFVAYLTGQFSPRQPKTVALDVGLSGLRFSLALLSIFWAQELVGREIDRRTVIFALTYPIPRSHYLIGRYVGILILSIIATAILSLALWLAVMFAGGQYEQQFPVSLGLPYLVTIVGLWIEVAIVTAFTLLIASLSTVAILPVTLGAAFTIGANSLGAVRDYLSSGADGDTAMVERFDPIMNAIMWIVPDLSRLDWRLWPMYAMVPKSAEIFWAVVMAVGYIGLMVWTAVFAFSRREFT